MKSDPTIQIVAGPGVYAPAEDTYLLLSAVQAEKGHRVLEMGCGTGIIALHCAKSGCSVTAADISPEAVECTEKNARRNGLDMEIIQSDLFESIRGKFDVVIFNPPYLSSAGSEALSDREKLPLVGGIEGSEISARFLDSAHRFLARGGRIYLLTSSETSEAILREARVRYSVEKVAERRIFFELLAVYELRIDNP